MNRKEEIIKLILNATEFISVDTIAKSLNTSAKTIRNELNSSEQVILENHCQLIRKPGIGVLIEGSLENKQKLLMAIKYFADTFQPSVEDRQRSIASQLLLINKPLLIKELVLDYYVSRSTINKDIHTINSQLKEFDLEIEYQKGEGVIVVGKEANKRKAIANLQMNDPNQNVVVYGMSDTEDSFLNQFEKLLNVNFGVIEKIVKEAEKELGYAFSSEARLNLVIHLAITINRTKQGNDITLTQDLMEALKNQKEFEIADSTAKKIERQFNVRLSETEVYYILLHFLGAKRIKELNVNNVKLSAEKPLLEELIEKFIKKVQLEMNIFLESDTELFNSLLLHLKPTINRLMYGLSLDNPLREEIMFSYPSVYEAIEKNVNIFTKAFDIPMPDNEIAYLVLHFAAARERNTKPIRVLVMCASGLGTSQLIVAKLKRAFSNLNIVDVVSSLEAENFSEENIDLIISTIAISSPIKTIVINPLLPETDMRVIKSIVEQQQPLEILDFEFNQNNTFLQVDLKNKEEALEFLFLKAKELNWAKENYLEGLHYRETLGPTVIGPYIAIPHAEIETIRESGLIFVLLKEPIQWIEDFEVKIIINVLASNEDIKKFSGLFENLAYLSDDIKWWNDLSSLPLNELTTLLNQKLLNHKGEREKYERNS